MRYIFPTAISQKSTRLGGISITQWFDNYSLIDPSEREELQRPGLQETVTYIDMFLEQEAKLVGRENVLLGGLGQGCAAALCALLVFQESDGDKRKAVGGFVGLSGWLPLRQSGRNSKASSDPRGHNAAQPVGESQGGKSIAELTDSMAILLAGIGDHLPLPVHLSVPKHGQIPVFLGHREADGEVSIILARQAAVTLGDLGLVVTLRTYAGLEHWWRSGDEIDDIDRFLIVKCGVAAVAVQNLAP
jgi:predicted esterase